MMERNDNDLLRDFFAENKKEIADNGFSRHVMRSLPDRENRLAQYWTIFVTIVSIVLFFVSGGLQAVWETIREVFIGMVQHGSTSTLDLKSLIIAGVVLLFLATKKVCSMA